MKVKFYFDDESYLTLNASKDAGAEDFYFIEDEDQEIYGSGYDLDSAIEDACESVSNKFGVRVDHTESEEG